MTYHLTRARLLAGAAALALAVASVVAVSDADASVPPTPSGWTQVFADDFNGAAGSGVNTGDWRYDLGTGYPGGAANWGTGEVETMTSSTANVYQDGQGHLIIKPIRDGAGNWTSGRIETQRTDFAAPPGGKLRFEASLQQPNVSGAAAAGYWPAFWSLGDAARPVGATNWPGIGEIDVMEDINGRSSEFATLHCGVAPGGPCNEFTGIGSGERACGGCQTGFHTYAMELDRSVSPEQIRWYLDGSNFFTVNANQVDATTWNNATHHGFFMILNVAIGGGFPGAFGGGPTGATQSGVPMIVDYVAAYTQGGGGPPPPPPSGSGGIGPITGNGGKCVDVDAANTANGTRIQMWDCNGTGAQQWTVSPDGSVRALGKCLDVTFGGTANATPIQLWDCNATGAQTWRVQTNGALLNPQSGRCLDDPNSNPANGTQLQIWDCNNTGAQQWHPPAGPITGNGGKCVDVNAANTANGTHIQMWDCNATNAQQWTVTGDGTLRALGKCLDVTSGGTANATPIQLWDCNATGAQTWQTQPNGTLLNPQSGRCLDDPAGNTANGTQLIIWDCNAGPNQQWNLS
jgi:Ricin-type beta-trefoil lectin domain/Glycosyl hydrolases family 16